MLPPKTKFSYSQQRKYLLSLAYTRQKVHKSLTLQKVQQRPILHQLSDDINWLLEGANGVQLNQLIMSQFLHDLSLCEEVLGVHSPRFQGFDGYRRGVVPQALPDLSELSMSEFSDEFERGSINLPLVARPVRQAFCHGFFGL